MKTGLNRPGILQVPLRVLASALPAMVIDELPVTGCHTEKLIELPPIHKGSVQPDAGGAEYDEPLLLLTKWIIASLGIGTA